MAKAPAPAAVPAPIASADKAAVVVLPFTDMTPKKDQEYLSDGLTGEADKAFEWLERAYVQRDGAFPVMKGDPLLRNIEQDPRYNALLKKMKLPVV